MKPVRLALLLAMPIFSYSACGADAQSAAASSSTIASTLDRELSLIEKEVVEAAEAMPEDKFNFSPEALKLSGADYQGVRNFAAEVKHIAISSYVLWAPLTGDKVSEDLLNGKALDAMKTKAEIIRFLKDSFALGHRATATLTADNAAQNPPGNQSSRLYLATFGAAHAFEHYGQMVEYLRMNGIVPPASR
jgi:hypothetical protein